MQICRARRMGLNDMSFTDTTQAWGYLLDLVSLSLPTHGAI